MQNKMEDWQIGPMGPYSREAINHPQAAPTSPEVPRPAEQKSEVLHDVPKLWDPNSDKTYTDVDVDVMYRALRVYFNDEDELRDARETYMFWVSNANISPVDAFLEAAKKSALAQEVDTRYANDGGLIFHLESETDVVRYGSHDYQVSPDSVEDLQNARALRKVQEIKKLMATNQLETAGGRIMQDLQLRPAVSRGPGAHARAEASAVSPGGMKCEIKDEFKNEGEVKSKVKDEDETMTELRLGDNWVIVKPEDANTPESG